MGENLGLTPNQTDHQIKQRCVCFCFIFFLTPKCDSVVRSHLNIHCTFIIIMVMNTYLLTTYYVPDTRAYAVSLISHSSLWKKFSPPHKESVKLSNLLQVTWEGIGRSRIGTQADWLHIALSTFWKCHPFPVSFIYWWVSSAAGKWGSASASCKWQIVGQVGEEEAWAMCLSGKAWIWKV